MENEPKTEPLADKTPAGYETSGDPRAARRRARRERNQRRILKTTAVLPSLFTISNGLLGFAAIHLATRGGIDGEPALVGTAAWLLFAAMFCDMIDGRLARFARRTSDFGGQLDSLCDVISFGVAPAVLMLRTVMGAVHGQVGKVAFLAPLSDVGIERILWCAAGVYVAGAALRLARFNVENEPDESAHMLFRGLPSPGAAAAVATLVLLFDHLMSINRGGWFFGPWLLAVNERVALWTCAAISVVLPVMTLATGLLMVSRFRYPHVVNQYIRGKRPFNYLVKLVVVVLVAMLEPFVALAAAAMVYVLAPPLRASWAKLRRPALVAPSSPGQTRRDENPTAPL
jgi:CDP-diacylglycerol--serine O-phosphatidyltransferase